MGSWNSTCAVSNLHIRSGQEVVVFMLEKNHKERDNFCYTNSLYQLCYMPFFGKNNSYGEVEYCHGAGLELLIEDIRENLLEMELGDNQYHDTEVKKDEFNIEKLFEADHENRLFLTTEKDYFEYDHDVLKHFAEKEKTGQLLDEEVKLKARLEKNLQNGVAQGQRITHIQVHAHIFNDILEKFYLKDYVANGKGGYKNVKRYFKDVLKDIPAVVAALQSQKGEEMYDFFPLSDVEKNFVADFLNYINTYDTSRTLSPMKTLKKMAKENKSSEEIEAVLVDFMKGKWFSYFMSATRKIYGPQCGVGSQSENLNAYEILTKSVSSIIKAEKKERKEWE